MLKFSSCLGYSLTEFDYFDAKLSGKIDYRSVFVQIFNYRRSRPDFEETVLCTK